MSKVNLTIPEPPTPHDRVEAQRWQQTRLRRRLLDGCWEEDLRRHAEDHLGTVRREAMGPLDYSANPFRIICRELSALYYAAPDLRHDEDEYKDLLGPKGAIAQSGIWSSMSRFQAWVIGCREYFMNVSVSSDGKLQYRPVPPDMVIAKATADKPDTPVILKELRLRRFGDELAWMWDAYDISDPNNPVFKIYDYQPIPGSKHTDYTKFYMGEELSGSWADAWRRADGTPFIPHQLYHAEHLGDRIFDAFEGMEMVEGSLNLSVAWSFWFHVLRDASWPQRYVVNAAVAGMDVDQSATSAAHGSAVMDPAALTVLVPLEDGNQTQIGQWSAGGDVEAMERAIQSYATKIAQDAGLPASDVQRMSGNARSGYAISLTNDGKRSAQRKFAPQFMQADEGLIAMSATMLNRVTGTAYPEDGYSVIYKQIPLSPQEMDARRDNALALIEAGLMSRVQAYMELHPGLTKEQAKADLAMIDEDGTQVVDTEDGADDPEVEADGPAVEEVEATEDVTVVAPQDVEQNVAATALNGAQVSSLLEVIQAVSERRLPRESAVVIIQRAFSVDVATAESMLGDVGRTFFAPEENEQMSQGDQDDDSEM